MTELEGSGGGAAGRLWRKHGGGYYALIAVGSFVYMEVRSIAESFASSEGLGDFLSSEIIGTIITLGLETFINSFLAGIWPLMWIRWMGATTALVWGGVGYIAWAVLIAWLLARKEKELKRDLGL